MREKPLSREEKVELETVLSKLRVLLRAPGEILIRHDGNGKVTSVEPRLVFR